MDAIASTKRAVLQATTVLSLVVWTKVFATNLGLGGAKNTAGTRAPEDTYQTKPTTDEEEGGGPSEEAQQNQERAQRIVNNDLENIPYTMVLAWGAAYCITASGSRRVPAYGLAHIVLYSVFVVCRIAHSIAYAKKIATARSLLWLVGALCSFGIAINGTIASFDWDFVYWRHWVTECHQEEEEEDNNNWTTKSK